MTIFIPDRRRYPPGREASSLTVTGASLTLRITRGRPGAIWRRAHRHPRWRPRAGHPSAPHRVCIAAGQGLGLGASSRIKAHPVPRGWRANPGRAPASALERLRAGDAGPPAGPRRSAPSVGPDSGAERTRAGPQSNGFNPASISRRRPSRNGGNASLSPRRSSGSSAVNPGSSVAISNRIPFGSRK